MTLACVGGVIVLNAASQFARFGETVLTGDALSLSLLRELGPVLTALLVAGGNSTGMASQLGSMLVTEQVDAIRDSELAQFANTCPCRGNNPAVACRNR